VCVCCLCVCVCVCVCVCDREYEIMAGKKWRETLNEIVQERERAREREIERKPRNGYRIENTI
jgi:hypothetical protein